MTRTRTRSLSPTPIIVAVIAVLLIILILVQPPAYTRGQPGDPQNPEPNGTMAVAEVLRSRGITVKISRTVSTALATPTDTLVITHADLLGAHQLEALSQIDADVVLIGVTRAVPSFFPELTGHGPPETSPVPPGCTDPRAAGGAIDSTGPVLSTPGATACFPGGDAGMVLTQQRPAGGSVTIIPGDILQNDRVVADANAALALRVLGQGEHLTWLIGTSTDPYGLDSLPEDFSLGWLWASITVMLIVLAWWRAPRFGRLVAEPLPVIVDASETTVGRGNLYRRSGDVAHAATALRLGALTRISERIGIPAHAEAPEVVRRVSQATKLPESQVFRVLYGPAPDGPASLHALALSLDDLEDEVENS